MLSNRTWVLSNQKQLVIIEILKNINFYFVFSTYFINSVPEISDDE